MKPTLLQLARRIYRTRQYSRRGAIARAVEALGPDARPARGSQVVDGYAYVLRVYGAQGDSPGDCVANVLADGDVPDMYWVVDGDDAVSETHGPYWSQDEACTVAERLADEADEGDGQDADALREQERQEALERSVDDGQYVVVWRSPDGDMEAGREYDSLRDAELEVDTWYAEVYQHTPGALTYLMTHPVVRERRPTGELVSVLVSVEAAR